MIITILSYVGAVLVGVLAGYVLGYYGTMKLIVTTLNRAIKTRETTPSTAAMMELPGLTLFRSIVRLRQF